MKDNATKSAAILVIGDEILSGRTQDINVQYIAKALAVKGIAVVEVRVIPDVIPTIVSAVNTLRAQVDYVFTTGGIGPTHDDKTAEALALAFETPLTRNDDAWVRLVKHYVGAENINPGRAKMADIPVGATLIDNPVSTAPGFRLENVYVMAGVPKIMQGMLEGVLPTLEGGAVIHSRSVTADVPESFMAAGLAAIEAVHTGISVGSYPRFTPNQVASTCVVVRGTDLAAVEAAVQEVGALMVQAGGAPVYS